MTFDYSGMAATATRLINRFGRSLTLRTLVQTGPAYDPSITNSDQTVTGVVTNFTAGEIDGSLVQANDKKIIIDSAIVPTVENRIVDGADEYSIVEVMEIKPGTTGIIYKLQVRRG